MVRKDDVYAKNVGWHLFLQRGPVPPHPNAELCENLSAVPRELRLSHLSPGRPTPILHPKNHLSGRENPHK